MQSNLLVTWKPEPIRKPTVDRRLQDLDALARSMECIRYSVLSIEFWISPDGTVREWLRHNVRIGVWLFIPAIFVMPAIGFILWQFTGWLSMFMSIAGKLIVLPILILMALFVIKIVVALLKR